MYIVWDKIDIVEASSDYLNITCSVVLFMYIRGEIIVLQKGEIMLCLDVPLKDHYAL